MTRSTDLVRTVFRPLAGALAVAIGLGLGVAGPRPAAAGGAAAAHAAAATATATAIDPAETAAPATIRRLMQVSAASGEPVAVGAIRIGTSVPVSPQTFAPFAGSGAWRLDHGLALQCTVELPAGARDARLEIRELGWLGTPEDHAFEVTVDGRTRTLPTSPGRALVTHALDDVLTAGRNRIVIANNREDGRVGIVALTVTYDLPLPTGRTPAWGAGPAGAVGSTDEPAGDAPGAGAPPEVSVTLLSPRPGQTFDREAGIPIRWRASGFPPGTGVAIHWLAGSGGTRSWRLIEDARDLPYDHPTGTGDRGHYVWRPDDSVGDLTDAVFALTFEPRARREPIVIAVGTEGGLETLAEAFAIARDGDVIELGPGTFETPSEIPVSLTIRGVHPERTTVFATEPIGLKVGSRASLALRELTLDAGLARNRGETVVAVESRGTVSLHDVVIRDADIGLMLVQNASSEVLRATLESVDVGVRLVGGRLTAEALTMTGGTRGALVTSGAELELLRSSITRVTEGVIVQDSTARLVATTLTGVVPEVPPPAEMHLTRGNGARASRGGTLVIEQCTIADFGSIGVGLNGHDTSLRVRGGMIRRCQDGIRAFARSRPGGTGMTVDIRDVTIEGCYGNGLVVQGDPNVIVRDVVIRNNPNQFALVSILGAPGRDVRGLQVYGNLDEGVQMLP